MTGAIDEAVQALSRLDILVANAGIFSVGPGNELDEHTWRAMIDVNLTGVWITTKVGIPTSSPAIEAGRSPSSVRSPG